MSILNHFDDKLKSILKIRGNHYDEACILIYVYIEYLSIYAGRKFNDNSHNKENFRNFIMNYSSQAEILKYIQIDRLLNHFKTSEEMKEKYGYYLEPYKDKFEYVRDSGECKITNFVSIDQVKDEDKAFFQRYTIANRIYEFRNFAVHEYYNKLCEGLDSKEPVLIYVDNVDKSQEGSFSILYPFEFLYEILLSCYVNVRTQFKESMQNNYGWLLKEDD